MDRETRRTRTLRVATARLRLRISVVEPLKERWCWWLDPPVFALNRPWHLRSASYYAKITPLHCNCRKRKHGQPKVWGQGMCCCDDRKRIYKWRQEAARVNRLVTRYAWEDWDEDELVR